MKYLRVERRGVVGRIVLARGEKQNALDRQTAEDLFAALRRWESDTHVRVVHVTSDGEDFCVGSDLEAMARMLDEPAEAQRQDAEALGRVYLAARSLMKPVVCSVRGRALGAGAGLALACAADLGVASASAKFTLAYTKIGLAPDGSSTWFLPRLVGPRRALELMLTNRVLSADEALALGLVNEVLPAAEVLPRAEALARELASGPTEAFASVKRLLLLSASQGLETQMECEARAIADAARTRDGREGIAAFLEKRAPRFEGR